MLSGIGDAEELSALDIPVVQHLPGVGKNLQDHLEVYVQHVRLPVCSHISFFKSCGTMCLRSGGALSTQWKTRVYGILAPAYVTAK